ncbi:MAG TPA: toxin-antitoxin system HicB family antitoxin [bacterium]|nr:toxin-antitoxin system HicB family antitoxin [bacterium]
MSFSGRFILRVPNALHGRLAREAGSRRISLNRLCTGLLQAGLERKNEPSRRFDSLSPVVKSLKKRFGKDLLGVLVFGSQVTGRATAASDVDLLIVLHDRIPLTRSLYRWWDESVDSVRLPEEPVVNPQFVHLPETPEEAGGLWLEIASASEILWDGGARLARTLEGLRDLIARDRFRRYWSNGAPYWVKT